MQRLLRISFNEAFFSIMPILTWFTIGLLVDSRLINIFSITYPLQFIYTMLRAIFADGANISAVKDKNESATYYGMVLGSIIGLVVFGYILLIVDSYIEFMHMDIEVYRLFTCFSIIKQYLYLLFSFVLSKLYFDGKDRRANRYCIFYSILNYITIVLALILFKNSLIAITISLVIMLIAILYYLKKTFKIMPFVGSVRKFIRYEATTVFGDLFKFITFLFGITTTASYGEQYSTALTFILMISDTQWDALCAVSTVAKIDISHKVFNFYNHFKEAYELTGILIVSSLLMGVIMFNLYDIDFKITVSFWILEMINFTFSTANKIYTCYLQLEYSPTITTGNTLVAKVLRMIFSTVNTPYCTQVSHSISEGFMLVTQKGLFDKNFKVESTGKVTQK